MTTATINGGPIKEPPTLRLGHCIAIGLELLMLGIFAYEGNVLGVIVALVYGYYFSATGAGIVILARRED